MSLYIELPPLEAMALKELVQERCAFVEDDWCELSRSDGAKMTYDPCDPPE